jgi:nucleotide-binding universal stress UspA family protein
MPMDGKAGGAYGRGVSSDSSHAGPILFAYDGSEHAKEAIRQAGRQLRNGRPAVVVTVWQPPAALPFAPTPNGARVGIEEDIEREARRVAGEGATLARSSGFDAKAKTECGIPTWQRIVESAQELGASIIVMGSHGRTGVGLVLMGSVAAATARHTELPVMIVHRPSPTGD